MAGSALALSYVRSARSGKRLRVRRVARILPAAERLHGTSRPGVHPALSYPRLNAQEDDSRRWTPERSPAHIASQRPESPASAEPRPVALERQR